MAPGLISNGVRNGKQEKGADGNRRPLKVRFSLLAERVGECGQSQEARSQDGGRTKPACAHRFRASMVLLGGVEFGDSHCRLRHIVAALQYRGSLTKKQ